MPRCSSQMSVTCRHILNLRACRLRQQRKVCYRTPAHGAVPWHLDLHPRATASASGQTCRACVCRRSAMRKNSSCSYVRSMAKTRLELPWVSRMPVARMPVAKTTHLTAVAKKTALTARAFQATKTWQAIQPKAAAPARCTLALSSSAHRRATRI
jgi:hypothetical protein